MGGLVIPLTAARIADLVGGELRGVDPGLLVSGPVVTDSRLAEPGSLFVAVAGERTDGHDHTAGAIERGAVLALTSREVTAPHIRVADTVLALGALARGVLAELRRGGELQVVGVTGSVGKTTTKDLLGHLLSAFGPTVAPPNSFNNEIGLPLTVLAATTDTRYLVLEMGASGPGHIDYLTDIAPLDVAVVLIVGHAHMETFGTVAQVAQAKAEIVAGLRDGGTAVLNIDDPRVAAMAGAARQIGASVLTFGRSDAADVRATATGADVLGRAGFTLHVAGSSSESSGAGVPVRLPLIGAHQAHNALAALGVGIALGLDLGDLVARLAEPGPRSAHRMALTERGDGVRVLDDAYNANPDSMAAALHTLRAIAAERRLAVLGDMLELGATARADHVAAGRRAAELGIDVLVAVGEQGEAYAEGASTTVVVEGGEGGGEGGPRILRAADVSEAESLLTEVLRSGDVVLLKASNGAGLWRLADSLTQPSGGERT